MLSELLDSADTVGPSGMKIGGAALVVLMLVLVLLLLRDAGLVRPAAKTTKHRRL